MSKHDRVYPGETAEYRERRNALLEAEIELRAKLEEVAELRRSLPPGGLVDNYVFAGADGDVSLADLFAEGKDSLVLYSYMYGPSDAAPCPMCTAYLDGANGVAPHVTQRTNFAVVGRSPIERLLEVAQSRGWQNLRLLSAADNAYAQDFHTETPDGAQLPLANVFVRAEDGIRHFWSSELLFAPSPWHPRHLDLLMPLWHYLDLTPEGRGEFFPSLNCES